MNLPFQIWKREKYWYYRLPGEKTFHSSKIPTTISKRKVIDTIYQKLDMGRELKLRKYASTFFKWGECKWIQRQHAKNRSFSQAVANMRRGHLENHIFPKFGDYLLSDINPVDVENWLISLDLSNQTKNHILYTLNIILREAKREKVIKHNPLDDIERMFVQHVSRDIFSISELRKLFPKDRDKLLNVWKELKFATLFTVLATTGIRSGEVRALTWDCVLWDDQAILILKSVKADGHIGDPKNREKRAILVLQKTIDLLTEWHGETPFNEQNHLVFYGLGPEQPYQRGTLLEHFRYALEKAEISTKNKNLKIHSFRHTYNTIMREKIPEDLLREFTGHKSEQMTDHYDHPRLESKIQKFQESRKLIEAALNF